MSAGVFEKMLDCLPEGELVMNLQDRTQKLRKRILRDKGEVKRSYSSDEWPRFFNVVWQGVGAKVTMSQNRGANVIYSGDEPPWVKEMKRVEGVEDYLTINERPAFVPGQGVGRSAGEFNPRFFET